MLTFHFEKKVFEFKFPAGTSRGVLYDKKSWFVTIQEKNTGYQGLGECSVIEGLSPDYTVEQDYFNKLNQAADFLSQFEVIELKHQFENEFINNEIEHFFSVNPSIRFGFEMAILDLLNLGKGIYFNNEFSRGTKRIPINGLIWMGDEQFVQNQINEKINSGYSTIKMKVGALDFNKEIKLLKSIRDFADSKSITIRVDANGAFEKDDVIDKLTELTKLDIHSIEQPIKPGNTELMRDLCSLNIIPIALDEELIGISSLTEKLNLLQAIQPHYIILKPSLHGGLKGTREWIQLAQRLKIGWWMTSALESNIGLSAICQFLAEFNNDLPQGLGTGSLFTTNFNQNLVVRNGFICQNVLI